MPTPTNSNFLSPTGFQLSIDKIPDVTYFAQQVTLPSLSGGVIEQATPVLDAFLPGDKISYGSLIINFILDESLENYEQVLNWMQGLYHPVSLDQYRTFHEQEAARLIGSFNPKNHSNMVSDGSLSILTNNNTPNRVIRFVDLFPVELSPLPFTTVSTDINYLTCRLVLNYTGFSF